MNKARKFIEENEPMIAVADAISRGEIGHNQPPDPIDEIMANYADTLAECENWLDGSPVENDGQLTATDALLSSIKSAIKDVKAGEESEAKPIYDQWKAIKARWKPTIDDLELNKKGLIAAQDSYKKKKAAEAEAAKRKAWEEADAKRREAEEAAALADASDLEAQREAEAKRIEAMKATQEAQQASKAGVKGMRTVHKHEITDMRAVVNWIAQNDKDAMAAFATEYVRKNFKDTAIAGVKTWTEKEAF